jgi:hypothetical protein
MAVIITMAINDIIRGLKEIRKKKDKKTINRMHKKIQFLKAFICLIDHSTLSGIISTLLYSFNFEAEP